MTILIIFILLLASLYCMIVRKKTAGTVLLVFGAVYVLLIGNGLVPRLMLASLQRPFVALPEPVWQKHNAIVLLGAGTVKLPVSEQVIPAILAESRINKAAQLYFSCRKMSSQCTLIISGGDAVRSGMTEAAAYQKVLLNLGVKATDIILESNSMNTFENAKFTSQILKDHHYDQIILVTSGIHLKRSLTYFAHFGIMALPALADYLTAPLALLPLSYNFIMTDLALHEYVGLLRYYL